MKIVIPNKGRAGILYERAFKLFPEALVCVGESDVADYSKVTKNLLVHPDDVTGIGPLRQWILDNVEDEIVVQVDDDVHSLYSLTGSSKKTLDTPSMQKSRLFGSVALGGTVIGSGAAATSLAFDNQNTFGNTMGGTGAGAMIGLAASVAVGARRGRQGKLEIGRAHV